MAQLAPNSVFLTGANRGIGLGLVEAIANLPNTPEVLFAGCRNPETSTELNSLAKKHPIIRVIKMDVTEHDKYPEIVEEVSKAVGDSGLNLLINNAAISDRYREDERQVDTVHAGILREVFETNAISPLLLSQAFLPLLRMAAANGPKGKMSCSRSAIINITSRAGSIKYNVYGERYPYRSSKAALNMITKSLSVDLKDDGIFATVLHPGWVQTRMGGPDAPTPLSECIEGLINVMGTVNESHSGVFLDYTGHQLPW